MEVRRRDVGQPVDLRKNLRVSLDGIRPVCIHDHDRLTGAVKSLRIQRVQVVRRLHFAGLVAARRQMPKLSVCDRRAINTPRVGGLRERRGRRVIGERQRLHARETL